MINLNAEYWNNRYLENDFGWDLGEVSSPIKAYFEQDLPLDLTILIPGAGNSYEAEFLFQKGFKNTYVLDFAEQAISNLKKRIPDFPENQIIQDDFFNHRGQYDLIIEQTFFCAINPSLRERYVRHMSDLLKPKGKLIGLLFNDSLNRDKPPFGGFKDDYVKLFSPKFNILTMDIAYNSVKPRAGRELFVVFEKD
jgi:methyl halide transferase